MGGGGGGDPGAEARRMEAERQARIKAATEEINRVFNNQVKTRGTQYVNFLNPDASPLTPEQYAEKKAAYDRGMAERMSSISSGKFNLTPGSGGFGNGLNFLLGRVDGFSPFGWKARQYDYWVDGDPEKSRQRLYDNQKAAVYDLNRMDVDRQADEAERANRFGLARSGLLGGSANVDSIADMDRRTNEGLMKAGGIADQASADLFAADERTRASLISLAQSGIDTGTAAQQALKGLEVNAANAAGARAGATVGDLFGSMSQAYLMNQMRQGQQAGMNPNQQQQWLGVSDTRKGYGGSTS